MSWGASQASKFQPRSCGAKRFTGCQELSEAPKQKVVKLDSTKIANKQANKQANKASEELRSCEDQWLVATNQPTNQPTNQQQ
jgi:hypothetical protein